MLGNTDSNIGTVHLLTQQLLSLLQLVPFKIEIGVCVSNAQKPQLASVCVSDSLSVNCQWHPSHRHSGIMLLVHDNLGRGMRF
jgi:hypothetical protein